MESDRDGEFAKEVEHWYKADLDGNKYLNSTEFLAFIHPEHNKRTLRAMVEEMMPGFDKNSDKVNTCLLLHESLQTYFCKFQII